MGPSISLCTGSTIADDQARWQFPAWPVACLVCPPTVTSTGQEGEAATQARLMDGTQATNDMHPPSLPSNDRRSG